MKKIILASKSPQRFLLLKQIIGENFEVIESEFEEDNNANLEPLELARVHSIGKARDVAKSLSDGVVIGSDTFLYFEGEVLGKPMNYENSILMLKKIRGKEVEIYSGVALVDVKSGRSASRVNLSKIKIRDLSDEVIERYVNETKPYFNAGAFKVQSKSAVFTENLNGDFSAIMGLPLYDLNLLFEEFGINIFDYS